MDKKSLKSIKKLMQPAVVFHINQKEEKIFNISVTTNGKNAQLLGTAGTLKNARLALFNSQPQVIKPGDALEEDGRFYLFQINGSNKLKN